MEGVDATGDTPVSEEIVKKLMEEQVSTLNTHSVLYPIE